MQELNVKRFCKWFLPPLEVKKFDFALQTATNTTYSINYAEGVFSCLQSSYRATADWYSLEEPPDSFFFSSPWVLNKTTNYKTTTSTIILLCVWNWKMMVSSHALWSIGGFFIERVGRAQNVFLLLIPELETESLFHLEFTRLSSAPWQSFKSLQVRSTKWLIVTMKYSSPGSHSQHRVLFYDVFTVGIWIAYLVKVKPICRRATAVRRYSIKIWPSECLGMMMRIFLYVLRTTYYYHGLFYSPKGKGSVFVLHLPVAFQLWMESRDDVRYIRSSQFIILYLRMVTWDIRSTHDHIDATLLQNGFYKP